MLRQGRSETVRTYGARVSEILSRGLEAVREEFSAEQLAGNIASFERAAIRSFTRGLHSEVLRLFVYKERTDNLETAVNLASRLERETNEHSAAHSSSQPFISSAKVFSNFVGDIKCFECNQTGHIRNNCPRINRKFTRLPARSSIRCSYCRKTGHLESRCCVFLGAR